jgi:hypothetical protein
MRVVRSQVTVAFRKARVVTAADSLALARKHLARVQIAWDDPTDWSDLTIYGMYAVEAAILAAAAHLGRSVKKTHWDKADFAAELAAKHGLPDASELVGKLNTGRKAAAYGDEDMPEEFNDPEDLATEIEEFVDAVDALIGEADS